MNKQDTAAIIVLVALLFGWFFYQQQQARKTAQEIAATRAAQTNEVARAEAFAPTNAVIAAAQPVDETEPPEPVAGEEAVPRPDEILVPLSNDDANPELKLTLSTHGGVIRSSTLPRYTELPKKDSDPVAFDYGAQPVLAWHNLPGLAADAAYQLTGSTPNTATFTATNRNHSLLITRRYELGAGYLLTVHDTVQNISEAAVALPTNHVALGNVMRGTSKNDMLGIDHLPRDARKVEHMEKDLGKLLSGTFDSSGGMGCVPGCGQSKAVHETISHDIAQQQEWVALKSRFFTHFYAFSQTNTTLQVTVDVLEKGAAAIPGRVSGSLAFEPAVLQPGAVYERTASLYIGPKRLATVKNLGRASDEIMQFGWLSWLCKPLVYVLNFFHGLIPNYGVAIILVTLLVRILFWPLTHKTAESSRKMAALQPKIKELQAKHKDNPQKLQQETWALYREEKVNPLSSCLPMLVQLPVFFALFTVLRSAVELRYASFLWVADLSEAENLFADILPIPLNILPIFMAGTMALQSYLTPAMGDPAQRRMMMIMMPVMMLFMLYTFPSALALYWTVSQLLAIVQLWWQRRRAARENADKNPPPGGNDDSPATRQMRRRLGRA